MTPCVVLPHHKFKDGWPAGSVAIVEVQNVILFLPVKSVAREDVRRRVVRMCRVHVNSQNGVRM